MHTYPPVQGMRKDSPIVIDCRQVQLSRDLAARTRYNHCVVNSSLEQSLMRGCSQIAFMTSSRLALLWRYLNSEIRNR